MAISDIITLVGLIIAIVAIISDKNRRHLLLKFHSVDYLFFVVSFLLINYFVFYESFFSKGILLPFLYFKDFGLRNPKNYAYLITIINLIYLFYKIWYAFYPFSKISSVKKFYGKLIENNETSFLLDLIERYHKTDIINAIEKSKDYNLESNQSEYRFHTKKLTFKEGLTKRYENAIRFLFPFSWKNRRSFAISVLNGILNDPAFIVLAANQRPYLFADIIAHFKEKKSGAFPQELPNSFLSELILHKNFWLKKELQQSQDKDYGGILSALFNDLSVAGVNGVGQPFGRIAVEEIEEERSKGYESKMCKEFRKEKFLWEFRTYYAIQFFKVLIFEAIKRKYLESNFLGNYYYGMITEAILKTYEKFPPKTFEQDQTIYFKFIETMVENCFFWLYTSRDSEDQHFYLDTLSCLGSLLLSICNSEYYPKHKKVVYLDSIFKLYCNLSNNSQTENLRNEIGSIILHPSPLAKSKDIYYQIVETAWIKFDKKPHRKNTKSGHEDREYFAQFKQQVIIPLQLDPNQY